MDRIECLFIYLFFQVIKNLFFFFIYLSMPSSRMFLVQSWNVDKTRWSVDLLWPAVTRPENLLTWLTTDTPNSMICWVSCIYYLINKCFILSLLFGLIIYRHTGVRLQSSHMKMSFTFYYVSRVVLSFVGKGYLGTYRCP